MWRFKFPNYVHERSVQIGAYNFTLVRKLDPMSYWMIRWMHGSEKLTEMALKKTDLEIQHEPNHDYFEEDV